MPDADVEKLLAEADDLLEIEGDAAEQATGGLRRKLETLIEELTKKWVQLFGSATARGSGAKLEQLLAETLAKLKQLLAVVVPVARTAIAAGALAAVHHGMAVAEDAFPAGSDPLVVVREGAVVGNREDEVQAIVRAGRERAAAALSPDAVRTLAQALTAVAAGGQRTAGELERLARTAANEAATAAARAVAEANDVGLLWVAERDACVHCLAYAGRTVEAGKQFAPDLTYGDKPLSQPDDRANGLDGPPLHPNCRCSVRPYDTSWDTGLPEALEREARRSIALGFKLDSEPKAVRLAAADRLLKSGRAGLPKTVTARARKAVAQGKFADRRLPANR